eukprot:gnl/Spiro4/9024_TR4758_c0_g1_i1.p1 gnl/Spiro4/9024_TR4758_c0_g1~~gnl/Spiro4/9024_TR4758_c0_g1_i1.p1  ORF type:complete len:177 (-),score=16.46 gnl/Spiro4/9024_TR4758_c0_g1_i1:257-754(-)
MSRRLLIALCGGKGHGKSTAAEFLAPEFKNYAFADPLKIACKALFVLDDSQLWGDKKEVVDDRWGVTPREMMQKVGTEMFRDQLTRVMPNLRLYKGGQESIWVDLFRKWFEHQTSNVVVSDLRFADECAAVRELGGHIVWSVAPTRAQQRERHTPQNRAIKGRSP